MRRFAEWLQRALGRSDIYSGGILYMRRWRLIHRKWFGVRLHHIVRSDADRELHDHPFTFVSIILWGGYYEHTVDGRCTWYGPGSIVVRSADVLHRLKLERETVQVWPAYDRDIPAWTLVFRGPLRREWGFLTGKGWVHWLTFVKQREGKGKKAGKHATESSI